MTIETRAVHLCHGGRMGFYKHQSTSTGTEMRFAVFVPPQAEREPRPALYYLAGLTCTEETFFIKAGAQRLAAELGLVLVACDTSPRGLNLPGDADHWDFGVGAGFYLDATQAPWNGHYRMARYINDELPALIESQFPVRSDRRGIFGHSMGGHGALVTALRNPLRWHSVSAFAPICNPTMVPWGRKAFENYLGPDVSNWMEWDASELLRRQAYPGEILVDLGLTDQFLEVQLGPQALIDAGKSVGQALKFRQHEGYDHSYWFVQSFVGEHLVHHARQLG